MTDEKEQTFKNENNHFIIPYYGNKRNEVNRIIYYFEKSNIDDYKYIVEPFCGSSCFSYHLWKKYKDKDYIYILNDNDDNLIKLYELLRPSKKDELKKMIEDLNILLIDLDKEKYKKIIGENTLKSFIFKSKVYGIRPGLYPMNRSILKTFNYIYDTGIYNFFQENDKNIILSCSDGVEVLKKYNNNESFLMIDPPYIQSYNDFYSNNNDINIYEYLYNNSIISFNSRLLLCLNDCMMTRLLFKDYIKCIYGKKYESTKRKLNHIIILNY